MVQTSTNSINQKPIKMIRPTGNNIVVRLRERQEMSKGGIHIPEAAQEAEEWGVCLGVGSKVKDISKNDVVFIRSTSGTHYRSMGEDYVIVRQDSVLCKIEE